MKRLGICAVNDEMMIMLQITGAIVIGTVCGPTRGMVLGEFANQTRTQGQIAVVIFAVVGLVITSGFLLTLSFSSYSPGWRSIVSPFCIHSMDSSLLPFVFLYRTQYLVLAWPYCI